MTKQAGKKSKLIGRMMTIVALLSLQFSLINIAFANQPNSDWESKLTTELNKLLPSASFSFDQLKVATNNKSISGQGTFFKQPNIGFEAVIGQEGEVASFTATIPSNAKVAVSNSALSELAGQSLTQLIPSTLEKSVYLEKFSLDFDKKDKSINQVNLYFNALNNWEVFQGGTWKMKQIKITCTTDFPTKKDRRKFNGRLTGVTTVGGKPVNLSAKLTPKKEDFILTGQTGKLSFESTISSMIGKSTIRSFDIPTVIFDIKLDDGQLHITPYQKSATLTAISNWGKVNVWVKKKAKADKAGKFDYLASIATHKDFKMSNIHAKLKVLDKVSLANQKIVYSSAKKSKKEAKKVPFLTKVKTGIRKGGSFIANLDVRKLKLEHLLQVKELVVNSPLTAKLDGVVLQAPLNTNIQMGPSAKLEEVLFQLKPSPRDFGITLIGLMNTKIGSDQLQFKGGMEVDLKSQALNFMALMDGSWNNPLGIKGMKMTDIGMQLGASFTAAPVILPNISITGQLKAGSFAGAASLAFDTRNPTKSMIAASFNKVGLMDLINLTTNSKVQSNIPREMKNTLQSVSLKDVSMEIVPQRMEVLEKMVEAGFRTAGNLNIAGFKGYAAFDIDYTNGILASGSINPITAGPFQLRGAKGKAKPAFIMDLRKGKSTQLGINGLVSMMGVSGETDIALLPNGFKFKVGGKLFNVFKGDITATGKDLAKMGEMGIDVKMKNDIMSFIDKETTKFISNSTKGAIEKLTTAQKNLTKAQNVVKRWEKNIKIERAKVAKKMAAKRKKYDTAKRNLDKAKKKVNSLNSKIKKLRKERDKLPKFHPKKAKYNAQIASLHTARTSANLSLDAAKLAMSAFKGMNLNPDLHPKIVSMNASKATAIGTMEGAKKTLDGIKWTLGVTGKVATYAIDKGIDLLIDIKKIDFAGKLGTVSGGAVKLNTQLKWMGKTHKLKFNFNLKNPTSSIKAFGEKLMDLKK